MSGDETRDERGPSLRWEDPPDTPSAARAGKGLPPERGLFGPEAAALRARRGEWAVVEVSGSLRRARDVAQGLKTGRYAATADGGFEAAARSVDGEYRVYARYVGTACACGV